MHPAADDPTRTAARSAVSWSATPRTRRWALIAAVATLVLAAIVGTLASRARPASVVRTVTAAPAADAPTVDASGCPVGTACVVTGGAAALTQVGAQVAAVRATFPAARIEAASVTAVRDSGTVLRTVLVVHLTAADSLAVWSSCVPGTATSADRTETAARTQTTLGGDTIVMSRLLSIHRHGAPGCSVVVEVDSTGADFRYRQAATRLAEDRRLQVDR